SSEFGGALGIALLGSAATAFYRSELSRTLPGGVPQHVAEVAKDTLGGALSVAGLLPDAADEALIGAARAAVTGAAALAFPFCAIISLATAVAAIAVLRQQRDATGGSN